MAVENLNNASVEPSDHERVIVEYIKQLVKGNPLMSEYQFSASEFGGNETIIVTTYKGVVHQVGVFRHQIRWEPND